MKKRYLTPSVCQISAFDEESLIMSTSNDQKTLVTVDPYDEEYYGKDGDDDYLMKF